MQKLDAPSPKAAAFCIVAIGASAGGLDACRKMIGALPAKTGMAFVLVQHLDPHHESMMVDLLASQTTLTVLEAVDGAQIEIEHLYVIPPGSYIAIENGSLRVTPPNKRHGARLPFDHLLGLMKPLGRRAIAIVLSGTGTDGTIGLEGVKAAGGFAIAQDPAEAAYGGMPRSAIESGLVDRIVGAAHVAVELDAYKNRLKDAPKKTDSQPASGEADWLNDIIALLKAKTAHDFTLYKRGTLKRRIERRMAMSGVKSLSPEGYLDLLTRDDSERDQLAKDLLINVTSFFRDPKTFEAVSKTVIPDIVRRQESDRPVRIWIAGCSTGEEAYSLAILFQEYILETKLNTKIQMFASDVDTDAIITARDGLYPSSIAADVSAARLTRFFNEEDGYYRVSPNLRASVVFTAQDVLADPPFSRIDFISCRNLLIYLSVEAQAKVIALFHFALLPNGVLLLGSSETIGNMDGRFEVISKPQRLYRRIGHGRSGEFGFSMKVNREAKLPVRPQTGPLPSRHAAYADICERFVIDNYGPAAVLITRQFECLYFQGPTDRYLKVPPGLPMLDLFSLVREGVRTKLRSALHQVCEAKARVVLRGGRMRRDGKDISFSIAAQPVESEGEQLLLVAFVEDDQSRSVSPSRMTAVDLSRSSELEQELAATKIELQAAIDNLEMSSADQKAVNEEALSVNEEYQSTNEELMTSKEELQSLNEELTALNGQLQETLERQRTTSNDLQNVLYSTEVATLFLDVDLKIRFFTPATKLLFNVIPGDIGRPLADLSSLAVDESLETDARSVLNALEPIEKEIRARSGAWYMRRILPYRIEGKGIEGVVITFSDITHQKSAADALREARTEAEAANAAKSRFLAAASHDLRQPLQTLVLLQELLGKVVESDKAKKLVARVEQTVSGMSGMLNALLDINKIEAGTVQADLSSFRIDAVLDRLKSELGFQAEAQRIALHVVPCGLSVRSDPMLLEQMIRNLLANALKYTKTGRVLLGCRRRKGIVRIEVWDTGVGIPDEELQTIFEEYHQLDNAARNRSLGLGLGLSIVRRLGSLLDHPVNVRSTLGKGSVFSIEVRQSLEQMFGIQAVVHGVIPDARTVLIVEDDTDVRSVLEIGLDIEGFRVAGACDGVSALGLIDGGKLEPDIIVSDFNLPHDMDGLKVIATLRARLRRSVPAIILTGDISTETLRAIAQQNCLHLNKPTSLSQLTLAIRRLLKNDVHQIPSVHHSGDGPPIVYVVDDDDEVRGAIRSMLEDDGQTVEDFADSEAFLAAFRPGLEACLLIDANLPGMSGMDLLRHLKTAGHHLPSIMITGFSDVPMAVQAMKSGATDFIEKPIRGGELLAGIARALEQSKDVGKLVAWRKDAAVHVAGLTVRQHQIMDLVLAGHPSKNIAADLGISQRTVENHRASIMKRTGSRSLPALARLALAADWKV